MLFVWSVYFSVQGNQANYFGHFAIHTILLEYIGKTTQSVKGQFHDSWKSGELIDKIHHFEHYFGYIFQFGSISCSKPRFTPKLENNTIFAHKIFTLPGYYLLSIGEVLFVCTSNLMCHCVITGVKLLICSHFTHVSGLFKHNCRHQAPAIVYCLANSSHFGLSIAHSRLKRQGKLAGT